MKQNISPLKKTMVLIGGGHTHVAVLKNFGMHPVSGLRVILITRDVHTPYSGMLPGYIAGHYDYDECHIDLRTLATFARASFIHTEVIAIDTEKKEVFCHDRPPLHYDLLSLNIGSRPHTASTPGAADYSLCVKPIDQFIGKWEQLVQKIMDSGRPLSIGIVGGGAGGVELSLCIQHQISKLIKEGRCRHHHEFHLLTDSSRILPTHNHSVSKRFARILAERNIRIYAGHHVVEVTTNELCCDNGVRLPVDLIIWVTHAAAPVWIGEAGIKTDNNGFILVNDYLQSVSHPDIFAAGDIAASEKHSRPKSGVFAVRQGPYLAINLRRSITGKKPLRSYRPQQKFLSLISTGNKYAVASRGQFALEGTWVWRLKDWIDRRFMRKYNELPEMSFETPEAGETVSVNPERISHIMRCSGCGAKVGGAVLNRVVKRLHPVRHDDVILGLDQPDDSAAIRIPPGKIIVQTVDYFRALIDDDFVFGKVTANHALGDIFAMGANPHTALAVATIPFADDKIVEEQLFQMLSGAVEVLNEVDCSLVGGHSSEGEELAFGLVITGLTEPHNILRKQGLQQGQELILTKPLGTGTLFAAAMQGKCKGRWIESAIEMMLMSNRKAAEIFLRYKATACTDVTGFGLTGHLHEMINHDDKIGITLDLAALPVLEGAAQTVSRGIYSSMYEKNLRILTDIQNYDGVSHSNYPLLFDPQTSGGLIGCIEKKYARDCLNELHNHGYRHATIIGHTVHRENQAAYIILKRCANRVN